MVVATALASTAVMLCPIKLFGYKFFNEPIYVIAAALILCVIGTSRFVPKLAFNVLLVGLLISVSFCLSLITSEHSSIQVKDVVEVVKPVIFSGLLAVGHIVQRYAPVQDLGRYCVFLALFQLLIAMLVYFPAFHPVIDMYKGRPSTDEWSLQFLRFSGTFGYPGIFSYWLALAVLLVCFNTKRPRWSGARSLLVAVLIFAGLLLTGGRGGLVVFAASFLVLLLSLSYWRVALALLLTSILLMLLMIESSFAWDALAGIGPQIRYIVDGLSDIGGSSAAYRVREFDRLLESLLSRPVLGNGPSNEYLERTWGPVENVYFYYGFKFGLVGLSAYFGFIVFALMMFVQTRHSALLRDAHVFWGWSLVCLTVGAFNESISEEYKSFYFFFLLAGMYSVSHRPEGRFAH